MNKLVITNIKRTLFACLLLVFIATACERSVDGLSEPEFPANPEVFIDGFSAGLEYYPYEESRQDAFSVDGNTFFGTTGASMRFDVPNFGDPGGAFAGAIFRDDNGGRNLTGFNALTFYAKASSAATVGEIGFGQDFEGNTFEVSLTGLRLTTNWRQYTIPVPDPSVLTQHRGLFWYSAGPNEAGDGFSMWVDELQYESLDDLAQPRPAIQAGNDVEAIAFIGSTLQISGMQYTANLPDGQDVTINAAPAYYEFISDNPSVATVDQMGQVTVVGEGTAEITASLAGVPASGSLTVESQGEFIMPPTPDRDPSDVISIFSNAYENVPVDFYNGFYAPFQTTTSNDFTIDGQDFLGYENFNFVGIEFNQNVPTIDGSEMTHLSVDIFLPNEVPPGSAFRAVIVNDLGGDNQNSASASVFANSGMPRLTSGEWITLNVDMRGMSDRSNLGQIVFDSDQGPALQGATIYVTNIYLYRE